MGIWALFSPNCFLLFVGQDIFRVHSSKATPPNRATPYRHVGAIFIQSTTTSFFFISNFISLQSSLLVRLVRICQFYLFLKEPTLWFIDYLYFSIFICLHSISGFSLIISCCLFLLADFFLFSNCF